MVYVIKFFVICAMMALMSGCAGGFKGKELADFREGEVKVTLEGIKAANTSVLYRTKGLTPELGQALSKACKSGVHVSLVVSELSVDTAKSLDSCVKVVRSYYQTVYFGSPTLIVDSQKLFKNGYFIASNTRQVQEELAFMQSLLAGK